MDVRCGLGCKCDSCVVVADGPARVHGGKKDVEGRKLGKARRRGFGYWRAVRAWLHHAGRNEVSWGVWAREKCALQDFPGMVQTTESVG